MPEDLPKQFTFDEVDSDYCVIQDRYVVSLVVSYPSEPDYGGVESPEEAVAYALDLTRDAGSRSTIWFVHDRVTGETHRVEQGDLPIVAPIALTPQEHS